ncbi:MAG: archease [Thermodesulfobacteriota bacterium]
MIKSMLDLTRLKYKIIDHTADICVRVFGNSLEEIFVGSSKAMMAIITDVEKVNPSKEFSIEARGENHEELLVKWLQEILYLHEVKKMVFKDFEIKIENGTRAVGKAYGEKIDFDRHEFYSNIKAVTYHNLKIISSKDKYRVDIVFDI